MLLFVMKMQTGTSAKKNAVSKQVYASGDSRWKYMGITTHPRNQKRKVSLENQGYKNLNNPQAGKYYGRFLSAKKATIAEIIGLEAERIKHQRSQIRGTKPLDDATLGRMAKYNLFQMGIIEKL